MISNSHSSAARASAVPADPGNAATSVCTDWRDEADDVPRQQAAWLDYERRKRAWLESNPGAWPLEVRDACARIAEELGL